MSNLPRQGFQQTACMQCEGSGVIFAWRQEEGYGPASYVFKCDHCTNWQGKADGLPSWAGREDQGYCIGETPKEPAEPKKTYEPKTVPEVKEFEMDIPF